MTGPSRHKIHIPMLLNTSKLHNPNPSVPQLPKRQFTCSSHLPVRSNREYLQQELNHATTALTIINLCICMKETKSTTSSTTNILPQDISIQQPFLLRQIFSQNYQSTSCNQTSKSDTAHPKSFRASSITQRTLSTRTRQKYTGEPARCLHLWKRHTFRQRHTEQKTSYRLCNCTNWPLSHSHKHDNIDILLTETKPS